MAHFTATVFLRASAFITGAFSGWKITWTACSTVPITCCWTCPTARRNCPKPFGETAAASGWIDGYIRLVVTRGIGNLGLNPFNCKRSCVYIIADKISLYDPAVYENGLSLITSSIRRNRPDTICPQVKSLNYLNNILAKVEAVRQGAAEALMLNDQGNVAECTGTTSSS